MIAICKLPGSRKRRQLVIAPQRTERGGITRPLIPTMTRMTFGRKEMTAMCTTVVKRLAFKADCERYRRYAEAKQRIPKNLLPEEYEQRIKKLARKYKI